MSATINPEDVSIPECQALRPEHAVGLASLFEKLRAREMEKFFHPHPLTKDEAAKRANYAGRDFYCVCLCGKSVVGYGMLRGWDESYETPSLGVAVDPEMQGGGYGRLLMEFLHKIARQRGANRIRLKVHPDNGRAVGLYRSLGYVFSGDDGGQIIGFLELKSPAGSQQKESGK